MSIPRYTRERNALHMVVLHVVSFLKFPAKEWTKNKLNTKLNTDVLRLDCVMFNIDEI